MKRTKITALASIVLLVAAVLLAACYSPESEDETAYITISLGGGASRTAVPWSPNAGFDVEAIPHDIKIGNTTVATGVHIGTDATFKHPVSAGTHKVEVRGYHPTATAPTLISYAEASVTVASGQTASCSMTLSQAFETSTTPWADAVTAIINAGGVATPDRDCYIFVTDDISVVDSATGNTFFATGINVLISGNHTITLSGQGSLLRIGSGQTVTLRGAHLKGNPTNNTSLVVVTGGVFNMESGTISGNTAGNGGGVFVDTSGIFTMSGGTISGNDSSMGGGVSVSSGSFTMSGTACIIENKATGTDTGNGDGFGTGGGVYFAGTTFTMEGGTISGNIANSNGGGVYVDGASATFDIKKLDLVKSNSAATSPGNQVYVNSGIFNIGGVEFDRAKNDEDYFWQ